MDNLVLFYGIFVYLQSQSYFTMKEIIILIAIFASGAIFAQNFQLHNDFERGHVTTTFEMFKIDKLGNTFTFIDFDYDAKSGTSLAYYEIARVFQTEKMPIGLHVEYNAGHGTFDAPTFQGGFTINQAWIIGANYSKGNATFGFSTYAGYKDFKDADEGNFQVTGTWYWNIVPDKLTFSGFADLWTEKGLSENTVFLSEPQLWFHLNKSFSIGGELEISSNFGVNDDAIKGRPTLGIKWNI